MKQRFMIVAGVIVGVGLLCIASTSQKHEVLAAQKISDATPPSSDTAVQYTTDGKLKLPHGFRRWVFLGAPLTPNALNDGEANFPEFHHVYVEEKNLDVYENGQLPRGHDPHQGTHARIEAYIS